MARKTNRDSTEDNRYFELNDGVIEFFLIELSLFFDSLGYIYT